MCNLPYVPYPYLTLTLHPFIKRIFLENTLIPCNNKISRLPIPLGIMSSRIRSFSKLVLELDSALKAFQSSDAKFRVLKTVYPPSRPPRPPRSGKSGVHGYGDVTTTTTTTTTIPSALSSRGEGGEERAEEGEEEEEEEEYEEDLSSPLPPPKTLFILDSSFNPPSIAHAALAQSAFLDDCNSSSSQPSQPSQQQKEKEKKEYEFPHRLLLLFAVTNADKIAAPASFEHRLAMMTCFARDLQDFFASLTEKRQGQEQEQQKDEQKQHKDEKQHKDDHHPMAIDIGVTKYPFYTDKSRAIESEQGQKFYPTHPRHIHLLGYDTLTRIFTAKYYIQQNFNPPFVALQPYFDKGYELRVTLRPDSTSAGPTSSSSSSVDNVEKEDQKTSFLQTLTDPQGEMQKNGARANWARQIEFVSPQSAEMGVSSTRIREAVGKGEWEVVRELCTPRVARWVEREGLYLG